MPRKDISKIDSIIWKEFDVTPPEKKAAEKLWGLGYTATELLKYNNTQKTLLPTPIWVKTMNALKDIENNFPKHIYKSIATK